MALPDYKGRNAFWYQNRLCFRLRFKFRTSRASICTCFDTFCQTAYFDTKMPMQQMGKLYAYARVSSQSKRLNRQIRNILNYLGENRGINKTVQRKIYRDKTGPPGVSKIIEDPKTGGIRSFSIPYPGWAGMQRKDLSSMWNCWKKTFRKLKPKRRSGLRLNRRKKRSQICTNGSHRESRRRKRKTSCYRNRRCREHSGIKR